MKLIISVIVSVMICAVFRSPPARCASTGSGTSVETDLHNFDDQFLDSHTEVAADLRRDASLVGSRRYLKGHPGLRYYFADHPQVLEQIHKDPKGFMAREEWYRTADGQRKPRRKWGEWDRTAAKTRDDQRR